MERKISLNNSVLVKAYKQIDLICKPLTNHLGIDYFIYTKLHKDGSRIYLTNHLNWGVAYNTQFYKDSLCCMPYHCYQTGSYIWQGNDNRGIFSIIKEKYKIQSGLMLIDRHKDSCEIYIFASSHENFAVLNFYLNNQDLLKRFVLYFKEKARDIIKRANADRFLLPRCVESPYKDMLLKYKSDPCLDVFLSKTAIKKYYIDENKGLYLTHKEALCAYLTTQGQSAKQIAKSLGISHRTVEIYLSVIKHKLNALSKADLIDKLADIGFLLNSDQLFLYNTSQKLKLCQNDTV